MRGWKEGGGKKQREKGRTIKLKAAFHIRRKKGGSQNLKILKAAISDTFFKRCYFFLAVRVKPVWEEDLKDWVGGHIFIF